MPPPEGAILVNHPASYIRRQAARLLDSAGVSHEPVSLRDVVSALNLELVKRTREPFTSEAALEPLVREAVREQGPDTTRLADRFAVSRKAMQTRLRHLGLMERHSDR